MQYHRKTLSILAAAALLIAGATQLSGCISVPSRESTTVIPHFFNEFNVSISIGVRHKQHRQRPSRRCDLELSYKRIRGGRLTSSTRRAEISWSSPTDACTALCRTCFLAKKTFPTRPKPTTRWNSASMASNDRCAPLRAKQPRQPT